MNGFYVYGSTIYGTHHVASDVDYVIIGDHPRPYDEPPEKHIPADAFMEYVSTYDPTVLEAYSLQFHSDLKEYFSFSESFSLTIDLPKLRRVFSTIASNSFVKAKKKLTIAKDYDRNASMKSLFHAIRILDFGRQLATKGYVFDFTSCNHIYNDLKLLYVESDDIILKKIMADFKPLYNQYATEFKLVAPKALE